MVYSNVADALPQDYEVPSSLTLTNSSTSSTNGKAPPLYTALINKPQGQEHEYTASTNSINPCPYIAPVNTTANTHYSEPITTPTTTFYRPSPYSDPISTKPTSLQPSPYSDPISIRGTPPERVPSPYADPVSIKNTPPNRHVPNSPSNSSDQHYKARDIQKENPYFVLERNEATPNETQVTTPTNLSKENTYFVLEQNKTTPTTRDSTHLTRSNDYRTSAASGCGGENLYFVLENDNSESQNESLYSEPENIRK